MPAAVPLNLPASDIADVLASLPMFRQLGPRELAIVCAGSTAVQGGRGQVLFARGDPATAFHVLLVGTVKLSLSYEPRHEKVLRIVVAGESFGEALPFLDRPCPITAECLADCELLAVSAEALLAVIDVDPRLARAMLAGLSLRLYELIDDVEAYTTRTAAQRLAGYLLHLAGHGAIAHLPTSKHVVASLLNLTPETLSRILHGLTEAGLIEVAGRRILIRDPLGLRAYA